MTTTQPHNPTTTDPFALIPGARGEDTTGPIVPPAPAGTFFVADDGYGEQTLWTGDPETCDAVATRWQLDRMHPVLWPTLLAALVEGGAR